MLSLDITKAKVHLGWKPQLSIEQAIEITVSWYKKILNNDINDTSDFCQNQIKEYLEAGDYIGFY